MNLKSRKGQMIEEVFKYGLVIALAGLVVILGYKLITSIKEKGCESEIAKFELEFRNTDQYVRQGEKELRSIEIPCDADKIYLFDLNKSINPESFSDIPIIKDSLSAGTGNNIFLIKDGKVLSLFNAGNLEIDDDYLCFTSYSGHLEFYVEGLARSVKVSSAPEQRLCS